MKRKKLEEGLVVKDDNIDEYNLPPRERVGNPLKAWVAFKTCLQ